MLTHAIADDVCQQNLERTVQNTVPRSVLVLMNLCQQNLERTVQVTVPRSVLVLMNLCQQMYSNRYSTKLAKNG